MLLFYVFVFSCFLVDSVCVFLYLLSFSVIQSFFVFAFLIFSFYLVCSVGLLFSFYVVVLCLCVFVLSCLVLFPVVFF